MSDDEDDVPDGLAAAWGLPRRRQRGPRPGLDVERIVGAAVRLAAGEGLAAVSMNRVARELDSAAMALYRYVAGKEELLALMVDAAVGPPPMPEPGEPWRAALERQARAYHAELQRHPWVLHVPISGPPATPNLVAWMEAMLRALAPTRLTETEKLSTILLVTSYVRSELALMADVAAGAAAAGTAPNVMPHYARLLRRLTDAERYPALHDAMAAGAFDEEDDAEQEFEFGLVRLLDGVAALVDERAAGG
jgi:AcrR family transcriptional regulator